MDSIRQSKSPDWVRFLCNGCKNGEKVQGAEKILRPIDGQTSQDLIIFDENHQLYFFLVLYTYRMLPFSISSSFVWFTTPSLAISVLPSL